MINPKNQLIFAALLGALSVILGAFAAHGLQNYTTQHYIEVFEKAVRYSMYHTFVILIVSLIQLQYQSKYFKWAVILFVLGIAFFSGSLYILVLCKIKWMGAITPIGGVCFVLGWILAAVGFSKMKLIEKS
jgi:uncharacterized membrane protein YgdD (TMEM256/DUF423 family)